MVVTGKFYALPKPGKTPPGQAKKNRPPAAPTGLTATAGDGQVTLDWADNTESDLAEYNVYRDGNLLIKILSPTSEHTDDSVENGTTYTYYVTAVDTGGLESRASNTVSATPGDGSEPPKPPTLVREASADRSFYRPPRYYCRDNRV